MTATLFDPPPTAPLVSSDEPRTWPITVTCAAKMFTPNARLHHRAEAALIRAWRESGYYAAVQAGLPKHLARVRIDVLIRPTTRYRESDWANLVDRAKPVVDGLGPPFIRDGKRPSSAVGYELIDDDNRAHLDGPHVEAGPTVRKGEIHRMDLLITDLSALSPRRTWTPERIAPDGVMRISVKRRCNGCGLRVGDVLPEEVAAKFADLPLPDVRLDCPRCRLEVST